MNGYVWQIFNSLSHGVAVVDDSRRIVGANARFYQWFGSSASLSKNASPDGSDADEIEFDPRGVPFYTALFNGVITEGDYCPFSFFEVQHCQNAQRRLALQERRAAREQAAIALRKSGQEPTPEELDKLRKIEEIEAKRAERWQAEKRDATDSTIQVQFPDGRSAKFEMTVSQFSIEGTDAAYLVELKKTAPNADQREKMFAALRQAGDELNAESEKAFALPHRKQVEILCNLIRRHMLDILRFNIFEIRLLDPTSLDESDETGRSMELKPLLSVGMKERQKEQKIFASSARKYGVTGYVGHSGEPYFCPDAENDFLFLHGAVERACCSITVPMLYHGSVVGVCNVESATPGALTKSDVDFVQLYANDLARAVQTLRLITLESDHTRRFCGEQIRDLFYDSADDASDKAIALQADANRLEAEKKIDPRFAEQIRETTRSVRTLRSKIGEVKRDFFNVAAPPVDSDARRKTRDALRDRDVLIVDSNREIARQVAEIFERVDCRVEIAYGSKTALERLKTREFDLVVCDLFPDGPYFDEIDGNAGRNRYGSSPYNVHDEHYDVPIDGDENDAKIRREALRKIRVERRLDGYFLKTEIDKLGLKNPPFYAVAVAIDVHDSTHVLSDLGALAQARGEYPRPFGFYSPTFSASGARNDNPKEREQRMKAIAATTRRFADALRERDKKIAEAKAAEAEATAAANETDAKTTTKEARQ